MTATRRLSCFAVTVALLSGCGLFLSPADRAERATPDYRAGYTDGCATSSAEGTNMRVDNTVRDDGLYRTSKAYRAGWVSGYSTCRRPAQGSGPTHDTNPGGGLP